MFKNLPSRGLRTLFLCLIVFVFGSGKLAAQDYAVNLTGDGDRLDITYDFNLSGFTIESWVYVYELPSVNGYGVFAKSTSNIGQPIDVYILPSGQVSFFIGNGSTSSNAGSSTLLTPGKWYHIAVSYDPASTGTEGKLYIDGAQEATVNYTTPANASNPVMLGNRGDGATESNLYFDDLRIWNAVRSQTQINDNKFVDLVGNETGLEVFYSFDGFNSNDLATADGSQNGVEVGGATYTSGINLTAAPVLSNLVLSNITGNSVEVTSLDIDNYANTVYYIITASSTMPNAAQINSGLDGDNNPAVVQGGYANILPNSGLGTTHSGLESSTTYYIHYVATDQLGVNSNIISDSFTTTISDSGYALEFVGANESEYISLGNLGTFPTQGTIELWLKAGTPADFRNAFDSDFTGAESGLRLECSGSSGDLYLYTGSQQLNLITGDIPTMTQWNHIAITWNQDTQFIRGYLNGVEVGNISGYTNWQTNMSEFVIGKGLQNTAGRYWDGSIDNFRIWNIERSAEEVIYGASNLNVTPTTNLMAAYTFNAGSGSILEDMDATNGVYDGTIFGSPSWVGSTIFDTDNIAPALFNGTPRVENATETGADLIINATDKGTGYYVVLTTGSPAPTVADVITGASGSPIANQVDGSSLNVTVVGTDLNFSISGLATNTTYDGYAVMVDEATNQSTSVYPFTVITNADLAPTLILAEGSKGSEYMNINVDVSELSTLYVVILTDNTNPPTASQVIAGTDGLGSPAFQSDNYGSVNGTDNFGFSGLSANTTYYTYWVAEDATMNTSGVVDLAVTTDPPPVNISISTVDVAGGTLAASTTNNLVYKMEAVISGGTATMEGFYLVPTATDILNDFSQFNYYESVGVDDFANASLIESRGPTTAAESISIVGDNSLENSLLVFFNSSYTNQTVYWYISADIAANPTDANTFSITVPDADQNFGINESHISADGGLTASNVFTLATCVEGDFIGDVDGDVNDPNNWCNGTAPNLLNPLSSPVNIKSDATITQSGDLDVGSQSISVNTGSTVNFNLGNFNLDLTSGTFTNNGNVYFNNANVVNGANFINNGFLGGEFTFASGLFTNGATGTLAPGNSPGCVVFGAGYNDGGGTTQIEVDGATTVCTEYDQLQVTGQTTLSGTLEVIFGGGYVPADMDSVVIIKGDGTAVSGTFSSDNLPSNWTINYNRNENNQVENGSVTLSYSSGSTLDFDGSTNYVNLTNDALFNFSTTFSFEAWLNVDAYPAGGTSAVIFNKWSSGTEDKYLYLTDAGNIGVSIFNTVASFTTTETIPTGTWTHVALTVNDGGDVIVYMNGVEIHKVTAGGTMSGTLGTMYLGENPDRADNTAFFDGKMDDVRFWSTERTALQIRQNAGGELVGNEAGLIAYYKLDGDVTDATANAIDGTNSGATFIGSNSFAAASAHIQVYDNETVALNDGGSDAFGNLGLDDTYQRTYTIINEGIAQMDITSVVSDNNTVFIAPGTFTPGLVEPGAQTTFQVTYDPGTEGAEGANINIAHNASNDVSPYTFGVTGTGTNNALDFDGSDDYVSISDNASNNFGGVNDAFTIECWVNPTLISGNHTMINKGGGGGNEQYSLDISTGTTRFYVQASGGGFSDILTSTSITASNWAHVAATYDGASQTMQLFINGELVGSIVDGVDGKTVPAQLFTTTNDLAIGAQASPVAGFFQGQIDEVRIWDVVRTAAQIRLNATTRIANPTADANLTAYYTFDQGAAGTTNAGETTLVNQSQYVSNDGTLNGPFTLSGAASNWVGSGAFASPAATTPNIAVTPASFDYGSEFVGVQSTDQSFIIESTGFVPITSVAVAVNSQTNGTFSINSDTGETTLNPGSTRTVGISVTPSNTSGTSASFDVSTAELTTVNVALTATGVNDSDINLLDLAGNSIADGGSFNFGTISNTRNSVAGFTIENVGNATFTASGVTNGSDTEFIESGFVSGSVGADINFDVTYTDLAGDGTAAFQIANDAASAENPYDFTVNATPQSDLALNFDGVDDYIQVADGGAIMSGRSVYTIEFWCKLNNTTGGWIMGYNGAGNSVQVTNGFVALRDATNSYMIRSNNSTFPFDNLWHHVAISNNGPGATGAIYIDGVSVGLQNDNANAWSALAVDMKIGQYGDATGWFPGEIDEIRIWSSVRTATEIDDYKDRSLVGTEPGLVAYYQFDNTSVVPSSDNTGVGGNEIVVTDKIGGFNGTANSFDMNNAASNWVSSGVLQPDVSVTVSSVEYFNGDIAFVGEKDINAASVTQTFTITNIGGATLNISALTAGAGDFSYNSDLSSSAIAPGASATFTVDFVGTTLGLVQESNVLTFTTDDPDETSYALTLEGRNLRGPASVASGLATWLRGEDAAADGSAWIDFSGKDNNFSAGTNPTKSNTAIGYQAGLVFSGAEYLLSDNSSLFAGEDYTKIAVVRPTGSNAVPKNVLSSDDAGHAFYLNESSLDDRPAIRHGGVTEAVSATGQSNNAIIMTGTYESGTTTSQILVNGNIEATDNSTASYTDASQTAIGRYNGGGGNEMIGEIAEVIAYNRVLDPSDNGELHVVESYLAMKYGLSFSKDLITSTAADVWTLGGGYDNGIAVIGRDDASNLEIRQNYNVSDDRLFAVGIESISADNASNTSTLLTDGGGGSDLSFLAWGHNGSANLTQAYAAANNNTGTDVPAGISERYDRVWTINEIGTDLGANLTLQIEMQAADGWSSDVGNFVLMISNGDTDFSDAAIYTAVDLTADILTFEGIDLNTDDFVSIGHGVDRALDFAGTDDAITAPDNVAFDVTDVTLEGWFYFNDATGTKYLVSRSNFSSAVDGDYSLSIQSGLARFSIFTNAGWQHLSGTSTINTGEWYHFAGVKNGSNIELYVNGALEGTFLYAGTFGANSNNPVEIGSLGAGTGSTSFFVGRMDNVKIWSDVRTPAEIRANALVDDASTLSAQGNLLAYYDFNVGSVGQDNTGIASPELTDLSGNGFHAALSGFTESGASSNWIYSDYFSSVAATLPNIQVYDVDGDVILDGSSTVSTTNNTDFGIVNEVGTNSTSFTYTIQNVGFVSGTITSEVAFSGGTAAGDFAHSPNVNGTVLAVGASTATTVTFDPSAAGARNTTLSFDYTGPNTYDFLVEGTGQTPNASSNIVTNYTAPATIDYTGNVVAAVDVVGGDGALAAEFTIQDGGGSPDADVFGTTLDALTLTLNLDDTKVASVALYDVAGTTEYSEVALSGTDATFTGLAGQAITAPDDGNITFRVYVVFKQYAVTDKAESLDVTISAASALGANGSTFAAADGGAASIDVSGGENALDVTASDIVITEMNAFDPQLTTNSVGVNNAFTLTAQAQDVYGNVDTDNSTSTVTLSATTSPGGSTFASASNLTQTLSSGVYQWSDLTVDKGGAYVITATESPNGWTDVTASFAATNAASDVIANPGFIPATDIDYLLYSSAGGDDIDGLDTGTNGFVIGEFLLRDGGAAGDDDTKTTRLKSVTFTLTNWENVDEIELFDVTNTQFTGEVAVSSATVSFTNISGASIFEAADNGFILLRLKVTFKQDASIDDNEQVSALITSATADTGGGKSDFAAADAGGAGTSLVAGDNTIEVLATKIARVGGTLDNSATIERDPGFSIDLQAQDVNNNVDLDYVQPYGITWPVAVELIAGTIPANFTAGAWSASGVVINTVFANQTVSFTGTGVTQLDLTNVTIQDTTSPNDLSLSPAHTESAAVAVTELEITFSEAVRAVSGNLILRDFNTLDIVESISVTNLSKTTIAGNVVTFTLSSILDKGTTYFVTVPAGSFEDYGDNSWDGLIGAGSWSFTTADAAAPTIVEFNPVSSDPGSPNGTVSRSTNITLTFDEPVDLETVGGPINIVVSGSNGFSESYDVTTSPVQITGGGTNEIVINPSGSFSSDELVTVTIPEGAFKASDDGTGFVESGLDGSADNIETIEFRTINTADNTAPQIFAQVYENFESVSTDVGTDLAGWTSLNDGIGTGLTGNSSQLTATPGDYIQTPGVTSANYLSFMYNASAGAVIDIVDPSGPTVLTTLTVAATTSGYEEFYYEFVAPFTGNIKLEVNASSTAAIDIDEFSIDRGFAPYDGKGNVAHATGTLSITFDEDIQRGTGAIRLFAKTDPDITVLTFGSASSLLSISGSTLSIDISSLGDLPGNVPFYVGISDGAIEDLSGNPFGGILNNYTWNFTTAPEAIPPVVDVFSPTDNATEIDTEIAISGDGIYVEFSEPVVAGLSGSVSLYLSSSNEVVETWNVTTDITGTADKLSLDGNRLTIYPTSALAGLTGYNIRITADAFDDYSGNSFAGLLTANQWNFTTGSETVITYPEPSNPGAPDFMPAHNQLNVSITPSISFSMSEPVNGVGGAFVTIQEMEVGGVVTDVPYATLDATDVSIEYLGSSVSINNVLLDYDSKYYIEFPTGSLEDNSGNATQSAIGGTGNWEFETLKDNVPPEVLGLYVTESGGSEIQYFDRDNVALDDLPNTTFDTGSANDLAIGSANFRVVFDEEIALSSVGSIYLYFTDGADDVVISQLDMAVPADKALVTVTQVDGEDRVIAFDFSIPSGANDYFVAIDPSVITDVVTRTTPNNFAGIDNGDWKFGANAGPDGVKPSFRPAVSFPQHGNLSVVAANTSKVQIKFDEPVTPTGGNLVIYYDGTAVQVAGVADLTTGATVSESSTRYEYNLQFADPSMTRLPGGTAYHVVFTQGAFSDASGETDLNTTADMTTWRFQTADDGAGPLVTLKDPVNAGTSTTPTAVNVSFTFDERVSLGTGTINLYYSHAPSTIATSFDASELVIDNSGVVGVVNFPALNLSGNRTYNVDFPNTVITDIDGNSFAGYSGTQYSFSTDPEAQAPAVVLTGTPTPRTYELTYSTPSGPFVVGETVTEQFATSGTATIVSDNGTVLVVETTSTPAEFVSAIGSLIQDETGNNATLDAVNASTTTVATTTNLVIHFDEPVDPAAGLIEIRHLGEGALTAITIDPNDGVSSEGKTVYTFTSSSFSSPLSGNTDYYVYLNANAFDDNSGNTPNDAFDGTGIWEFKTQDDVTAPLVVSRSPLDDNNNVTAGLTTLSITFNERVVPTSGLISLYSTLQGSPLAQYDVTSDIVLDNTSSTGTTVSFDAELSGNVSYYVQITAGAFEDLSSTPNAYAGIADVSTWNFSTGSEAIDPTNDPKVISLSPAPAYYDIAYSTPSGPFNVGEVVSAGTGFATVVADNGTTMQVTNSNNIGTFAGTVTGETSGSTATISTVVQQAHSQFDIKSNLVLVFDEPVFTGSGTITVQNADASRSQVITANNGALVTGSGTNTVTVDLPEDLDANDNVHKVLISNTAFKDASNNFFDGTVTGDWNFSTNTGILVDNGTPLTTSTVVACEIGYVDAETIYITESNNNDFADANGTNYTLILTLDAGYEFEVGVGSVASSVLNDLANVSLVVAANTLTIEYDVTSQNTGNDQIVISGLAVNNTNNSITSAELRRTGGTGDLYGANVENNVNYLAVTNRATLPAPTIEYAASNVTGTVIDFGVGDLFSLDAVGAGGNTYEWSYLDGTIVSNATSPSETDLNDGMGTYPNNFDAANSGIYTIQLTEVEADGCTSPTSEVHIAIVDVTQSPIGDNFLVDDGQISILGSNPANHTVTFSGQGLVGTDIVSDPATVNFNPGIGQGDYAFSYRLKSDLTGQEYLFNKTFTITNTAIIFNNTVDKDFCVDDAAVQLDADTLSANGFDTQRYVFYGFELVDNMDNPVAGLTAPAGYDGANDGLGDVSPANGVPDDFDELLTDGWMFDPSGLAPGKYTIKRIVMDTTINGFDDANNLTLLTNTFKINALPTVQILDIDDTYYCEDVTAFNINARVDGNGVTVLGYSLEEFDPSPDSTSVLNTAAVASASFNPADPGAIGTGPANYRIIYTSEESDYIIDTDGDIPSKGCINIDTAYVQVLAKPAQPTLANTLTGIGGLDMSGQYVLEYTTGTAISNMTANTGADSIRWFNNINKTGEITGNSGTIGEVMATTTLFGTTTPNGGISKEFFFTQTTDLRINGTSFAGCQSDVREITIDVYSVPNAPVLDLGSSTYVYNSGTNSYVYEYCGTGTVGLDAVSIVDNMENTEPTQSYYTFYGDDGSGNIDLGNILFSTYGTYSNSFDPTLLNAAEGFNFAGTAPSSITVHVKQTDRDNTEDGNVVAEYIGAESASTKIVINVNETQAAPDINSFNGALVTGSSADFYICQGESIGQIETPSLTGSVYEWATDNTMGSEVFVDEVGGVTNDISAFANRLVSEQELIDHFGYDPNTPGTYTYYVRQYTDENQAVVFNGCPSDWTTVNIFVLTDPVAPTFDDDGSAADLDPSSNLELRFCEGDLNSFTVSVTGDDAASVNDAAVEFSWYSADETGAILNPTPRHTGSIASGVDLGVTAATEDGGINNDGNYYFVVSQSNYISENGSVFGGCETEEIDMALLTISVRDIPSNPVIQDSYAQFNIADPVDDFVAGEVIEGVTSGATATVVSNVGTSLRIETIDGIFQIGEVINNAGFTKTSTINNFTKINNDFYYCSVDDFSTVADIIAQGEVGATYNWYESDGTTPIGDTDNTFDPQVDDAAIWGANPLVAGDYTYYVAQNQDANGAAFAGCESSTTTVNIHILSTPNAPDLNSDGGLLAISKAICDNGGASNIPVITVLNPADGLFNWYQDVNNDNALDGGDISRAFEEGTGSFEPLYGNMVVANDDVTANNYIVQQLTNKSVNSSTFAGCPSAFTSFDIIIHDIPVPPTINGNAADDSYIYCVDDPAITTLTIKNAADYLGAGVTFNWYSNNSLTQSIPSADFGLTINADDHSAFPTLTRDVDETISYYVTTTEDGCSSDEFANISTTVTYEFNPLPDLEIQYVANTGGNLAGDDLNGTGICFDETLFTLQGWANGGMAATGTFAIYGSQTDAQTDAASNSTANALVLAGFDGSANDGTASFDPTTVAVAYSNLINEPDLTFNEIRVGDPITLYINFYYTDAVTCDDVITNSITIDPLPDLELFSDLTNFTTNDASVEFCESQTPFTLRGNRNTSSSGTRKIYHGYGGFETELVTYSLGGVSIDEVEFDPRDWTDAVPGQSGTFDIRYEFTDDISGCYNDISKQIIVNILPEVYAVVNGGCIDPQVEFDVQLLNDANDVWNDIGAPEPPRESPFTLAELTYEWFFYNADNNGVIQKSSPFADDTGFSEKSGQMVTHNFDGFDGLESQFGVILEATSAKGCKSDTLEVGITEKSILIKINPNIAMEWDQVIEDQPTEFFINENLVNNDQISGIKVKDNLTGTVLFEDNWVGTPPNTTIRETEDGNVQVFGPYSYDFGSAGLYELRVIMENDNGCLDSLIREVNIVPLEIVDPTTGFTELFDGSSGFDPDQKGWYAENLVDDAIITYQLSYNGAESLRANSWIWSELDLNADSLNLISSVNGDLLDASSENWGWGTLSKDGTSYHYLGQEDSWLYSPAFDFSALNRPMLKMTMAYNFEESKDGVIVQYSTDRGATWTALGSYANGKATGLNWYNFDNVSSDPGQQQNSNNGGALTSVGWSGTKTAPSWISARHTLDDIPEAERSNVRFRISIASTNSNKVGYFGFAMADFTIQERSKNVLIEQFVSVSDEDANGVVNTPTASLKGEIYNIIPAPEVTSRDENIVSYHLELGFKDPFNLVNTAGPSARSIYYNVDRVTSILDGTVGGEITSAKSGDITWTKDDLRLNSLKDPGFNITLTPDPTASATEVKATVQFEANQDYAIGTEFRAYVVILEDTVAQSVGGISGFGSVMRKMLPSGSGAYKKLATELLDGELLAFEDGSTSLSVSWDLANIADDANLSAIVFIQNSRTKEIYQSVKYDNTNAFVASKNSNTITDVADNILTATDFTMYPNPTDHEVFIIFNELIQEDMNWTIFDQSGRVFDQGSIQSGNEGFSLQTDRFPSGLYYMSIRGEKSEFEFKKLMITH